MEEETNNGRLLTIADLEVEEIVTKEAQDADTKKIKLVEGNIKLILEGPARGLERFKTGMRLDVVLYRPQQTLTEEDAPEE